MTRGFDGGKTKYYWNPMVIFTNTDIELISWLRRKSEDAWFQFYEYEKKRTETQKPCHVIVGAGIASVHVVLETTHDLLLGKRRQAELVMSFTASRLGKYVIST